MSTFSDGQHEALLRRALLAATESVEPAGNGLERIQSRLRPPAPLPVAWTEHIWSVATARAASWLQAALRAVSGALRLAFDRFAPDPAAASGKGSRPLSWLRPLAAMATAVFIVAAGSYVAIYSVQAGSNAGSNLPLTHNGGSNGGSGTGGKGGVSSLNGTGVQSGGASQPGGSASSPGCPSKSPKASSQPTASIEPPPSDSSSPSPSTSTSPPPTDSPSPSGSGSPSGAATSSPPDSSQGSGASTGPTGGSSADGGSAPDSSSPAGSDAAANSTAKVTTKARTPVKTKTASSPKASTTPCASSSAGKSSSATADKHKAQPDAVSAVRFAGLVARPVSRRG